MPTTIIAPPKQPLPPLSADRQAHFERQGRVVTDRFVACKIGGMLMSKLLGFIEDEDARIRNVSETHVTLQLGRHWFQRMTSKERRRPVEVTIHFAEPGEDLSQWTKANARRSIVHVQLRPLSSMYATRDFHRRADAILHNLRLHFVAD